MTPRYTARRSEYVGNPYWYVHDTGCDGEADWNLTAERDLGIPEDIAGYTEDQAHAVAAWLNKAASEQAIWDAVVRGVPADACEAMRAAHVKTYGK